MTTFKIGDLVRYKPGTLNAIGREDWLGIIAQEADLDDDGWGDDPIVLWQKHAELVEEFNWTIVKVEQ